LSLKALGDRPMSPRHKPYFFSANSIFRPTLSVSF
jgi:hypothetical protein